MNHNAMLMLEALRMSSNECTREAAYQLLYKGDELLGPKGIPAIEWAASGGYGDFVQAVMKGDFLEAYGRADSNNQRALRSILGTRDDLW